MKEEAFHHGNIPSEEEITAVSSPSAQKQNTSKRMVNSSYVISVNADIDEINNQIGELIEKVNGKHYVCKVCGKISTYKSHANEHAEVHIEGLSFPCSICGQTFKTRHVLRSHKIRKCQLKN